MQPTGSVVSYTTRKDEFYKRNPDFDWHFYKRLYPDLAHLKTEEGYIWHYTKYGEKECRRTHPVITTMSGSYISTDIRKLIPSQCACRISHALAGVSAQFRAKFPFLTDYAPDVPCIFFGMYTDDDIYVLHTHVKTAPAYVIWGGEDANISNVHSRATVQEVCMLSNIIHLSISTCIYNSLLRQGIKSIPTNLNLVDSTIFPAIRYGPHTPKRIYVYNGSRPGREDLYGKRIYENVLKRVPSVKAVFSNTINVAHDKMCRIYEQCFIALRLTGHDGNANTVQECVSVGLPIVYNFSANGLAWESGDDVLLHIQTRYHTLYGEYLNVLPDIGSHTIPLCIEQKPFTLPPPFSLESNH